MLEDVIGKRFPKARRVVTRLAWREIHLTLFYLAPYGNLTIFLSKNFRLDLLSEGIQFLDSQNKIHSWALRLLAKEREYQIAPALQTSSVPSDLAPYAQNFRKPISILFLFKMSRIVARGKLQQLVGLTIQPVDKH